MKYTMAFPYLLLTLLTHSLMAQCASIRGANADEQKHRDLSVGNTVYKEPRHEGYRVDRCKSWGTDCDGKSAADEFCKRKGHLSGAATFTVEDNVGTTQILGPLICDDDECDGFKYITCNDGSSNNQGVRFDNPKYNSNPLDYCHGWATNCDGISAATAFCELQGYDAGVFQNNYYKDENIGLTQVLGICPWDWCDSFADITCVGEAQSQYPSGSPSQFPSGTPSRTPSNTPSQKPSVEPSVEPSSLPSSLPSSPPSSKPSISQSPSGSPSQKPSSFVCPTGQSVFELSITYDQEPKAISWYVWDACTFGTLVSSVSYDSSQQGQTFVEKGCLESDHVVEFVVNRHILSPGGITISVDGVDVPVIYYHSNPDQATYTQLTDKGITTGGLPDCPQPSASPSEVPSHSPTKSPSPSSSPSDLPSQEPSSAPTEVPSHSPTKSSSPSSTPSEAPSQDPKNPVYDSNSNIIYTPDSFYCPAGSPGINILNNDCDCNKNSIEKGYRTPCCGVDVKQCMANGAITDLSGDGLTFVNPSNNGGLNNPYQLPPPHGQDCAWLSPPRRPAATHGGTCPDRYVAYRSTTGSMTFDEAQALCQSHGSALATFNPYDENFGSWKERSAAEQYRDLIKTCFDARASGTDFENCWFGAVATGIGGNSCQMHHGSPSHLGGYFYRKYEDLDRNLQNDGYLDNDTAQLVMPLQWTFWDLAYRIDRLNTLLNGDATNPASMEYNFNLGISAIISSSSNLYTMAPQFLRFVDFVRRDGSESPSEIAVCENPAYFQTC